MACKVRSLGWARIDRKDFGEQSRFVIHHATTNVTRAGKAINMIAPWYSVFVSLSACERAECG